MLNCTWTSVQKVFWVKSFDACSCLVDFNSLYHSHSHVSMTVKPSFYIIPSQFFEFSLFTTALNTFLSRRLSNFLTEKKRVKLAHCLEDSVAIWWKTIKTEAVGCLLSACCIEALDFATKSCSLKRGHDVVFKATGPVLWKWESICLWIEISTPIKTGGPRLLHRLGVLLARIIPHNWFGNVSSFWIKVSATTALREETRERPLTISSGSFSNRSSFICLREKIEFCVCGFVWTNFGLVW